VEIERSKVRLTGRDDIVPMALRVTTLYRHEGQEWNMIHRHANNSIASQATESIIAPG
jgi:hypothetical protein